MPLKFKNELNYDSFEQFAKENAVYAFMQALTATRNDRKSEKLASKALFLVLKNKKHFNAESKNIDEQTAVGIALRSLLSRKEKEMLENAPTEERKLDEILKDDDKTQEIFTVYPPSDAQRRRIVKKACQKANSVTPKYAPMYTGTKSGLILLFVLVFICGAIYFIWNDPADLLTDKTTEYGSGSFAVSVPESGGLIDVKFEACTEFTGTVPVKIRLSGPDNALVSSVTYSPESTSVITSAYKCGDEYWVMTVNSDEYYKVSIQGTNGLDITKYFRLGDSLDTAPEIAVSDGESTDTHYVFVVSVTDAENITVSSGDIIDTAVDENGNIIVSVPRGSERVLEFRNSSKKGTLLTVTADGQAVTAPEFGFSEMSIGHDSVKEFDFNALLPADGEYTLSASAHSENLSISVNEYNTATLTALNGFVGIDSIDVTLEDSHGIEFSSAIPVIVVNSAPYYSDSTALYTSVKHTPASSGYLFGTLSASDAQKDRLTYTLTAQTDCSVTLSPRGSFMLFIDKDYRGHTASFDFTVSDGIMTSEPYRYTVSLENSIPAAEEYTQEFVCYTGENGWYTVELPKTDADGDTLVWSIATELTEDGRTPEGNYISFENGLSSVLIRPNPERNEDFEETLVFTCSDGWLSSDAISVNCKFEENKAPTAGEENRAEVSALLPRETFFLDIKDDCEFDICAIIGVISCTGGEVTENLGWKSLEFTVDFDTSADSFEPVEVILLVEDIVTKETVEVEYTIYRINE